jgi:predicted ester cyclase
MIETDLADIYRNYIACLNRQDWPRLGQFVDADVRHNGRPLGLSGYRAMLEQDFRDIPDLHFTSICWFATRLMSQAGWRSTARQRDNSLVSMSTEGGSRLPRTFSTNVGGKIVQVWSVIDKMAIEA